MNVLMISGSPRKHGKTFEVLSKTRDELQKTGNSVELIHLIDTKMNGCLGCNRCFEDKERPYCIQGDEAQMLFDKILTADATIYASPVYAFSFTAQMKAFLDRHYCLVTDPGSQDQSSLIEGKRVAMLATCCDPIEKNADLVSVVFDRLFKRLKCAIIGEYVVEGSFSDGFDSRAERVSSQLVNDLVSA